MKQKKIGDKEKEKQSESPQSQSGGLIKHDSDMVMGWVNPWVELGWKLLIYNGWNRVGSDSDLAYLSKL